VRSRQFLPNENAFARQCNPSITDSSIVRLNEEFGCKAKLRRGVQ
jgi:hypothetical protein